MDWINWLLIGIAGIAALVTYRRMTALKPKVESTLRPETRKQAAAMIPPPEEGAAILFALPNSPMRIKPVAALARRHGEASISWFAPSVCDSLWNQQRTMLLRLERELDIAQEAELSAHFVAACSARHPPEVLTQINRQAEQTFQTLRELCGLQEPMQLWYGRAMILLLSSRKSFDHVAWLTGATALAAQSNEYLLVENRVVFIPLYATRYSDFRSVVRRKVTRAFLFCQGETVGHHPHWIEEGIARWMTMNGGEAEQVPESFDAKEEPIAPLSILDDRNWEQSRLEPARWAQMELLSGRVIQWLLARHGDALRRYLAAAKLKNNPDQTWQNVLNMDGATLIQTWVSENPPTSPPPPSAPQTTGTSDLPVIDSRELFQ